MKALKSKVALAFVAVIGMSLAVYHYSSKQTQILPKSIQQTTPPQEQTDTTEPASSSESQTKPQVATVFLPNHRIQTIHKDRVDVVFVDSQHGWKMVPGQGAMSSEPVNIYKTTDGGVSWVKVSVANQTNVSASESTNLPAGTLPYGGVKNGLSFLNTSTGWITGYVPRAGYQWIHVTNDGGKTWVHQELPVPKDIPQYTSMSFDLVPPVFFTSKDGLLSEKIADLPQGKKGPYPTYVFFYTQDGGENWEEQPSSKITLNFPNSDLDRSGQTFSVSINGATWQTSDCGYTWTK